MVLGQPHTFPQCVRDGSEPLELLLGQEVTCGHRLGDPVSRLGAGWRLAGWFCVWRGWAPGPKVGPEGIATADACTAPSLAGALVHRSSSGSSGTPAVSSSSADPISTQSSA